MNQIDKWLAECEAATPGPWKCHGPQKCRDHTLDCDECGAEVPVEYEYIEIDRPTGDKSADMILEISTRYFCTDALEPQDGANARFIASARTRLPAALRALKVAESTLRRLTIGRILNDCTPGMICKHAEEALAAITKELGGVE